MLKTYIKEEIKERLSKINLRVNLKIYRRSGKNTLLYQIIFLVRKGILSYLYNALIFDCMLIDNCLNCLIKVRLEPVDVRGFFIKN